MRSSLCRARPCFEVHFAAGSESEPGPLARKQWGSRKHLGKVRGKNVQDVNWLRALHKKRIFARCEYPDCSGHVFNQHLAAAV